MNRLQVADRPSISRQRRLSGWRAVTARSVLALTALLISAEIAAQGCVWYLQAKWEQVKQRSDHYYAASSDDVLAYELARNKSVVKNNKRLHINDYGIRAADNRLYADQVKIALLGDSVTFGIDHSQNETISALLQELVGQTRSDVEILNFGVAGYGLNELEHYLRVKDAIYDADHVVYLFNPNDFAWRGTRYEGADNGLYRMYRRPLFGLRWMINKLVYRLHKGGGVVSPRLVSVDWYRWMYSGNAKRGMKKIAGMHAYCQANEKQFSLVLLPAGCAYNSHAYLLRDMYDDLVDFAHAQRFEVIDCSVEWDFPQENIFDATDHLTLYGNRTMASTLARLILSGEDDYRITQIAPRQK